MRLRLFTFLFLLPLPACLSFQKQPVTRYGTKNFVQVGSDRIYVADLGKGPAILMIHGYCGFHDHWMPIQQALSSDYRVVAPDLPGSGRSDKYNRDYSPHGLAKKLLALLSKLGIKQAHVMGHSWGTSVAMAMAMRAPNRVKSLTLISVFLYDDQLPPFITWSRAPVLGEILYGLFFDQLLDERMGLTYYDPYTIYAHPQVVEFAEKVLDFPGYKAASLAAVRGMRFYEMEPHYRSVTHRTLIIQGANDPISRPPWGIRMHSELQNSRLLMVPRARHMPMVEQPGIVLQALRPFLAAERSLPSSNPTVKP